MSKSLVRHVSACIMGVALLAVAMSAKADDVSLNEHQREATVAALKPLKAFCGQFATKVARGSIDKAEHTRPGTASCQMRCGGFAFSIAKHEDATDTEAEYDDLMVFTYNANTAKVEAVLYQADKPTRHIDVDVTDKQLTLNYAPLKAGDMSWTTREIISLQDGGSVRWQINVRPGDGEYMLAMEIVGTPAAAKAADAPARDKAAGKQ